VSPKRDEVRALLERFRTEAPDAARTLARETVRSLVEGLSGECAPGDWLRSRGGIIALAGGAGLFATGYVVGRSARLDSKALLRVGVAVAAGAAAGWFVATQSAKAPGASAS